MADEGEAMQRAELAGVVAGMGLSWGARVFIFAVQAVLARHAFERLQPKDQVSLQAIGEWGWFVFITAGALQTLKGL